MSMKEDGANMTDGGSMSKTKTKRSGHSRRWRSDIPSSVAREASFVKPYNPAYGSASPPYRATPFSDGPSPGLNQPHYFVVPPYPHQQTQYHQFQPPLLPNPALASGLPPSRPRGGSVGGQEEHRLSCDPRMHSERSKNGSRGHRSHRKSKSGSAAAGTFGAYWDLPPPPPPPIDGNFDVPSKTTIKTTIGKFSPRDEFRKLALGLSSPKSNIQANSSSWSNSTGRNFSNRSMYGATGEASHFQQRAAPTLPLLFLPPDQMGGAKKVESSRKMHERQQSAQMFMEETRGTEQLLKCRNVLFLLIFVFHLIFIGYLGQLFGKEATMFYEEGQVRIYYHNFIYLSCLAGAFAVIISALMLGVMMIFARKFVQIALFGVISISFIWGTVGVGLSPKTVVPLTGIIALGVAVAYTFIVWDRIPFAAANLLTALSGIQSHPGLILVAFVFQALTVAYSVAFSVVVVGVYDEIHKYRKLEISPHAAYFVYVFLAISFYWTYHVLQGAVQAITAGVIGGWWHRPSYDNVVLKSCYKTLFYSMGSICFGGLFVGPVRILRLLSSPFRPSAESSSLECLQECIFYIQSCTTSCIDYIATSCNSWAFTYIGMYHYGFLDAGYHATELFDRRGWAAIVSDDLVPNVLFLTSVVIGGATGCFTHIVAITMDIRITLEGHGVVPFCGGAILGFAVTSVLFSMIGSAVDSVVVCFAVSPVDFEKNHKDLSHEMRSAWREVWPGALDVCDTSTAMSPNGPMAFHTSIRFSEAAPLL